MSASFHLSVLDQAPVPQGSTGPDALRNTIDLAGLADRLGFERYWLAEHHASHSLACTSPEILIAAAGMVTNRIRLGSGGVMLPHYSPLKVAEVFSTLAGLFPGRIDLGLGRAPGSDQLTAWALQRDRNHPAPDDFPNQLAELLAYIEDKLPADHPFARLSALPGAPQAPEPWLLGSSGQSAVWAAEAGLPYAFAEFIGGKGVEIAAYYRDHFTPSARLAHPRLLVAVRAACAETDAEALRVAASQQVQLIARERGLRMAGTLPIETALRMLDEWGIELGAMPRGRRLLSGSPAWLRVQLEEVAEEYGAEEMMILTNTFDHEDRRRSYALIAQEFGLVAPVPELAADA